MSRDKFLAAVRKNPDDDTPRLVLADWLEENTENASWPKFIRLQIQQPGRKSEAWECVADAAREAGLGRLGAVRRGPYRRGGDVYVHVGTGAARFWVAFDRGLPRTLGYGKTLDRFVETAGELFVWPIAEVRSTVPVSVDTGYWRGPNGGLTTYDWWNDEVAWADPGDVVAPNNDGVVPAPAFRETCRLYAKVEGVWVDDEEHHQPPAYIEFPSAAAAYAALSHACVSLGRKAYRAARSKKEVSA